MLAGYDTPEHVEQAVAYETADEAEKNYAAVLAKAPRNTFGKGECTYCGHCKPCPKEIDIAMVNKYYDLAVMQEEVPATVREHYFALEHQADACIGCKACESRCPFGGKNFGTDGEDSCAVSTENINLRDDFMKKQEYNK